jgi:hypothetical protein
VSVASALGLEPFFTANCLCLCINLNRSLTFKIFHQGLALARAHPLAALV